MKKILFMLLAATTLFSSCSSDNDSISQGGDTNTNTKKYTVNLNVKSTGFEIDKTPLRSVRATGDDPLFQYVVYNEDGTVYSDSIYIDDAVRTMIKNNNIPFQLSLPEGKYHLAILYMPFYRHEWKDNIIKASNLNTDYYNNTVSYDLSSLYNVPVYYEIIDLQVSASENNEVNEITLGAMWSYPELTLTIPKSMKMPIGANALTVKYTNAFYGFWIKTKLAETAYNKNLYFFEGGDLLHSHQYLMVSDEMDKVYVGGYWLSKSADNNIALDITYGKYEKSEFTPIANEVLDLNHKLDNGYVYKISGALKGYQSANNNQSFNISLGSFSEEEVVVEF